jgi:hypothetical protein
VSGLDLAGARQAVLDHAMQSGLFDGVLGHEPISTPRTGLTVGVWAQHMKPVARHSGLDATSARVLLFARVYTSVIQTPADDIDLLVADALSDLMGRLTADYTLGSKVAYIDLLAAHGIAMEAELGYVKTKDGDMQRIGSLVIPLIFSDVWEQAE